MPGRGKFPQQVGRQQAGVTEERIKTVTGEAMQIGPEGGGGTSFDPLREQPADQAGEDVAHAAGRHAGVPAGVDSQPAIRCSHYGTRPFEEHYCAVLAGEAGGHADAVGLHLVV